MNFFNFSFFLLLVSVFLFHSLNYHLILIFFNFSYWFITIHKNELRNIYLLY